MRNNKGFTVIELIVVVALIAILSAILFPVFLQANLAQKQEQCLSNMKDLGQSLTLYYRDNGGQLPASDKDWSKYFSPYITTNFPKCPLYGGEHSGYAYQQVLDVSRIEEITSSWVFFDSEVPIIPFGINYSFSTPVDENNVRWYSTIRHINLQEKDGCVVGFLDGSAKFLKPLTIEEKELREQEIQKFLQNQK